MYDIGTTVQSTISTALVREQLDQRITWGKDLQVHCSAGSKEFLPSGVSPVADCEVTFRYHRGYEAFIDEALSPRV